MFVIDSDAGVCDMCMTNAEGFCDPLGNENIFATVRPLQRSNTSPVIVVAARVGTVISRPVSSPHCCYKSMNNFENCSILFHIVKNSLRNTVRSVSAVVINIQLLSHQSFN